eukprot:jgi/Botrbrau1/9091/Bobra.0305s0001.1
MKKKVDNRLKGVIGRQSDLGVKPPKKRLYRARAHSNPLNDAHFPVPVYPGAMDWSPHFPKFFPNSESAIEQGGETPEVQFADVGCGFGGLLVSLSPLYPETLMVGMELRDKVTEYVKERISSLRRDNPGQYGNITAIRTNGQKYLPNYFRKGQLRKLFFLFPDPHFKKPNHRRRVIQSQLLAEYAYLLQPGGLLYTITDVPELSSWMRDKMEAHPLFQRVSDDELASDPAAALLATATEEGQKVARNGGQTWRNVYRRISANQVESTPSLNPA